MQELLSFANHLADESGKIIRQYFRQPLDVETKTDASPVTAADKGAEARLREIIERERPEDGILGEEYGPRESRNGYCWVLDPIDGTKSFVIGRASFGTLIALCKDGEPVLGIIDQPILKERWAGDGQRTTFNGAPARARACASLKEARLASTAPAQLSPPNTTDHVWQTFDQRCAYTVWGGDCYSYGLLANGGLDAVVETCLAPYDYLALVPIVRGAGGWMGDWNGVPLTLSATGKAGRTVAVGDERLKDPLLDILKNA